MSINSVRYRVIRNALSKITPQLDTHEWELPPLQPGQMQLYSYFTPGLSTGLYDIKLEQTITSGKQIKTVTADPQSFIVYAPTFSIDPGLIHSTYPPEGVAAQANILPHVVFNDPHLPWQTEIGKTSEKDTMRIPWLAVVAFEQSELQIPPDDPLFPTGFQGDKRPPQTFTMATRLTIDQVTKSGLQCALPDLTESIKEDDTLSAKSVDVIFPEMSLFSALFAESTDGEPTINLDRYKYLAHTRQVNTEHMTDAGILEGGQFSIVFSHRTGPPFAKDDSPHPKRCVAHVVSLDWVHRIPSTAIKDNKRAALISLYSWTYDCPPPTSINFRDVMKAVGMNNEVFGTPKAIYDQIGTGPSVSADARTRLQDRMKDGYTLVRYKVQTGEDTVAFMRGPLTPQPDPDADWFDVHTNTGEDLQTVDSVLGIMDITYCAAWQLGKSLAIADQSFCAALLRIRASVYDGSTEKAKEEKMATKFEPATSSRVITALPGHFGDMTQLAKEKPDDKRWSRPSLIQSRYEVLAESSRGMDEDYENAIEGNIRRLMKAHASADDGTTHSEFKNPASTDWDHVLNWVLNKIYLEKIPPWYLIPDPTWLASESIRFFHVDRKWLSALVDGALSVANHLDVDDKARQEIKNQLVKYLNSDIHPILQHPPQIPAYGFFLRSVAVAAFPDMVVRAPWPDKSDPRAEVLRQENVRKDIMFVLLDRTPHDLQQLIISQPPHQQCFTFGQDETFTADGFEFELRKVYGTPTEKHMDGFDVLKYARDADGLCDIYDWNSRTIRLDKLVTLVGKTLEDAHTKDSDVYNKEVNAALMGVELNDPIYRLTFTPGGPSLTAEAASEPSVPSADFALPGGAASAVPSRPPPPIDQDRPFKKGPRRTLFKGTPSSDVPKVSPPLVSPSFVAKPIGGSVRSLRTMLVAEEDTPSWTDSDPRFEDAEPCDARFSPRCFALGDKSLGKTGPVSLSSSEPISLVIALTRNQTDLDSDDFIRAFEISIPLGKGHDDTLLTPVTSDDLVLLNTVRCKPYVVTDAYGNFPTRVLPGKSAPQKCFVVRLEPKAVSLKTPLSYNLDMSFVIRGACVNPGATDAIISVLEWYINQQESTKYTEYTITPIKAQAAQP